MWFIKAILTAVLAVSAGIAFLTFYLLNKLEDT